jgi:hypothetical protein
MLDTLASSRSPRGRKTPQSNRLDRDRQRATSVQNTDRREQNSKYDNRLSPIGSLAISPQNMATFRSRRVDLLDVSRNTKVELPQSLDTSNARKTKNFKPATPEKSFARWTIALLMAMCIFPPPSPFRSVLTA